MRVPSGLKDGLNLLNGGFVKRTALVPSEFMIKIFEPTFAIGDKCDLCPVRTERWMRVASETVSQALLIASRRCS